MRHDNRECKSLDCKRSGTSTLQLMHATKLEKVEALSLQNWDLDGPKKSLSPIVKHVSTTLLKCVLKKLSSSLKDLLGAAACSGVLRVRTPPSSSNKIKSSSQLVPCWLRWGITGPSSLVGGGQGLNKEPAYEHPNLLEVLGRGTEEGGGWDPGRDAFGEGLVRP